MKISDFRQLKEKLGRTPTWEEENQFEINERRQIKKYANHLMYTDVDPYEVIRVISPLTVEVREMKTNQIRFPQEFHPGGFSGHYSDNKGGQEYEYISDPEAPVIRIRFSKKGIWNYKGMRFLMADHPYKFYDYNF